MKTIGIDIGGTRIKAGLVEGREIKKKVEVETEADRGKDRVVQNIVKAIESVFVEGVNGIGIGFAGVVENGKIMKSPHLPLEGFDIEKYMRKRFGKKVFVDHDVNCAILAESRYGTGKGYKDMVMITIGTGIGGGAMVEGKLYKSKSGAGEIGHTTINFDGIKSTCCNNYGCFEEYVSARGLQRIFGKMAKPEDIADMARKGDKKARQAYQEMGRILGIGIVNIANNFDPDIVIVGGGLSKSWELFEKEMRAAVKERELLKTKIAKAKLEDAGIIGAALLV